MKVALEDRIRTTVEIRSGFQVIETGTEGVVFDTHDKPDRSYLIDLGADSEVRYTVLFPGEFEVIAKALKRGCPKATDAAEAPTSSGTAPSSDAATSSDGAVSAEQGTDSEAGKPAKAPVPATAGRR